MGFCQRRLSGAETTRAPTALCAGKMGLGLDASEREGPGDLRASFSAPKAVFGGNALDDYTNPLGSRRERWQR